MRPLSRTAHSASPSTAFSLYGEWASSLPEQWCRARTRPDDRLAIAATGQPLRVRGLFVQDTPAERAAEGDRVALNVTGARLDDLARGDWIVAESTAGTTRNAALELEVLGRFPACGPALGAGPRLCRNQS